MNELMIKYHKKLIDHNLCDSDDILIACYDDEIIWNKHSDLINKLEPCFNELNINSLLFAKPKEPYFSALNFLAEKYLPQEEFCPDDTETRTFLHSIPVARDIDSDKIISLLQNRKSVYILNKGIITYGSVSPEQAFVTFSSVCFAGFVKFFTDYYYDKKLNKITPIQNDTYNRLISICQNYFSGIPDKTNLLKHPFKNSESIISAMNQAGKKLIEYGMVDSFFGNISYRSDDMIYISQTGSSLDELIGYIDIVPVDGSKTTGLTASSEFSAHKEILLNKNNSCILHGHPKFSVIISMLCDKENCKNRGLCHIKCSEKRHINNIPIITGEVGTGKYGLSNTLPLALQSSNIAIVFGHGVFCLGTNDYNTAFNNLINTEKTCFDEFMKITGR